MPFVKLDCGILNSTLWFEKSCRDVFMTALLMAEPFELREATEQIAVDSLAGTGWIVPPGWYGFVPAAGVGIIHRAQVDEVLGREALRLLGEPEATSRTPEFDGRRLVRVAGGYIVLNYMKYRERDYTSAERSRRYRERVASRRGKAASHRDITQAEAEAEVEAEVQKKSDDVRAPVAAVGRGGGLIVSPLTYAKAKDKHRHFGARLRIPNVLHSELMAKLGGDDPDGTLAAWYAVLDAEVEQSKEPIPDVFQWIRPKFIEWAEGAAEAAEWAETLRVAAEEDAADAKRGIIRRG